MNAVRNARSAAIVSSQSEVVVNGCVLAMLAALSTIRPQVESERRRAPLREDRIVALTALFDIDDLVELFKFDSRDAVYSGLKRGTLPPPIKVGRRLRWDADAVRQWLADRQQDPEE